MGSAGAVYDTAMELSLMVEYAKDLAIRPQDPGLNAAWTLEVGWGRSPPLGT